MRLYNFKDRHNIESFKFHPFLSDEKGREVVQEENVIPAVSRKQVEEEPVESQLNVVEESTQKAAPPVPAKTRDAKEKASIIRANM